MSFFGMSGRFTEQRVVFELERCRRFLANPEPLALLKKAFTNFSLFLRLALVGRKHFCELIWKIPSDYYDLNGRHDAVVFVPADLPAIDLSMEGELVLRPVLFFVKSRPQRTDRE